MSDMLRYIQVVEIRCPMPDSPGDGERGACDMRLSAFSFEAMTMTRQVRDPDTLAAVPPSQAELTRVGYWNTFDRLEMDAAFRLAVSGAVEAGLEHCATEPSTHFGTRAPIANYSRP